MATFATRSARLICAICGHVWIGQASASICVICGSNAPARATPPRSPPPYTDRMKDKTRNPKIEGANAESVDVDIPEQGEPEARDRSRMAKPTPPERVIPRNAKRTPADSPRHLEREAQHDQPRRPSVRRRK